MENYYSRYADLYKQASPEARAKAKAHWLANHKDNLKHGREDLIIFSAQMLASIAVAEAELSMTERLVQAYNDYIHKTFCYQGSADDYEPERDDARLDGDLTNLCLLYTSDGNDTCYQWTLNIPERWVWCQIEGDDDHCVDCFFKDEDELLQWLTNLDEDLLMQTAEPHVENFNRRHA